MSACSAAPLTMLTPGVSATTSSTRSTPAALIVAAVSTETEAGTFFRLSVRWRAVTCTSSTVVDGESGRGAAVWAATGVLGLVWPKAEPATMDRPHATAAGKSLRIVTPASNARETVSVCEKSCGLRETASRPM